MADNRNILEELEKYLHERFKNSDVKLYARELLQKKEWIDYIVKDIAKSKDEEKILYDNYFVVYDKVERFYVGYILEEERKMKIDREIAIEKAKIKNQDKLASKLIISNWLDDLNKKK